MAYLAVLWVGQLSIGAVHTETPSRIRSTKQQLVYSPVSPASAFPLPAEGEHLLLRYQVHALYPFSDSPTSRASQRWRDQSRSSTRRHLLLREGLGTATRQLRLTSPRTRHRLSMAKKMVLLAYVRRSRGMI